MAEQDPCVRAGAGSPRRHQPARSVPRAHMPAAAPAAVRGRFRPAGARAHEPVSRLRWSAALPAACGLSFLAFLIAALCAATLGRDTDLVATPTLAGDLLHVTCVFAALESAAALLVLRQSGVLGWVLRAAVCVAAVLTGALTLVTLLQTFS